MIEELPHGRTHDAVHGQLVCQLISLDGILEIRAIAPVNLAAREVGAIQQDLSRSTAAPLDPGPMRVVVARLMDAADDALAMAAGCARSTRA
jgi:hypothetical protein